MFAVVVVVALLLLFASIRCLFCGGGASKSTAPSCGIMLALSCLPIVASESDELETLFLTNFNANSPDFGWYVQNDNVMGGRSEGGFNISSGHLIFSGNTNTNGGGFSSIRTQPLKLNLVSYTGIRVKVNGKDRD